MDLAGFITTESVQTLGGSIELLVSAGTHLLFDLFPFLTRFLMKRMNYGRPTKACDFLE